MKNGIKSLSLAVLLSTPALADLPYSELVFPRDSGGHLANTSYDEKNIFEYWYHVGSLQSTEGQNLSYSCVIMAAEFPTADGSSEPMHWAYMTIIDQDNSILYQGKSKFNNTNVKYSNQSLDINYGNKYQLKKTESGIDQLSCQAFDPEVNQPLSLSLFLQPTKEKVLTGGNGMIDMPDGGNAFHYVDTRMITSGSAQVGDVYYTVNTAESQSWTAHSWGDFFPVQHGWDWFKVSLDNGLDAIFFLHADKQRNIVGGTVTIVTPEGQTKALKVEDINYHKSNYWTSPKYGHTYPLSYQISVPELELSLDLEVKFAEQVVDSMLDGLINVSAVYKNQPIEGTGFVNINIMD